MRHGATAVKVDGPYGGLQAPVGAAPPYVLLIAGGIGVGSRSTSQQWISHACLDASRLKAVRECITPGMLHAAWLCFADRCFTPADTLIKYACVQITPLLGMLQWLQQALSSAEPAAGTHVHLVWASAEPDDFSLLPASLLQEAK